MDNCPLLLTGGNGFLGRILRIKLEALNFNILTLSRKDADIIADISKPFKFSLNTKIDVVIHAAGKAHLIPKTKEEVNDFYAINFEGTKNLCLALDGLKVKPKAFIFISTVAVYGLDEGTCISESSPLLGDTPYAKSKIMAEQLLVEWASKNGIKLSILRLPLVAGVNPPGNLGNMIDAIRSNKYLSIGNAKAKKSMIWAEDVAEVIPKLMGIGGTYNLTDGYHPSFAELELAISKSLSKRKPYKIPFFFAKVLGLIGDMLGRKFPINSNKLNKIISTMTFDDSEAQKKLDWQPTKVLDKIIEMI